MALIAVAADKGAPGVTTASVALAAVWPRPVLLAECDPAGGDLVYRLPAADGGRLDPRRGLLSLAVAARRGLQPHQVWEHAQKLRGGLDILTGVSGAEQGAGLELLWGSVGRILAAVPQADVIADCGRVGVDGPVYDLLAQASAVILLTRVSLGEVIRLRDRVSVLAAALQRRGRPPGRIDVVVITDYKNFGAAITEVGQALRQGGAPARVVGGLAYEPKSANQLRGEWSSKLDKSMFIRTARAIAGDLASALSAPSSGTRRSAPAPSAASGPAARPASGPARARHRVGPEHGIRPGRAPGIRTGRAPGVGPRAEFGIGSGPERGRPDRRGGIHIPAGLRAVGFPADRLRAAGRCGSRPPCSRRDRARPGRPTWTARAGRAGNRRAIRPPWTRTGRLTRSALRPPGRYGWPHAAGTLARPRPPTAMISGRPSATVRSRPRRTPHRPSRHPALPRAGRRGAERWTTASSSGCAATSATGWPSSGAAMPRPGCS